MHFLRLYRQQSVRTTRRLDARRRPLVESLEGRQLLSGFSVTNPNDSGAGSLRQAILSSNATTGTTTNTITFDISTSGTQTIALKSALPEITHSVVIDGTSEPGTGTTPRVVINGSSAGSAVSGFSFNSQAPGSTLKGLAIIDYSGNGVVLDGSNYVTVTDDFIGTVTGTTAARNGDGIVVTDKALNSTITGNTISGNTGDGVDLVDGTASNVVQGNRIGTNSAGTAKLDNGGNGVFISDSNANTISGNTISQNNGDGVHLQDGADDNVIQGNFLGTDYTGTVDLGNLGYGVSINDSAHNTVGGTTSGARNIISENELDGVDISNGSTNNVVEGNYIGTDVTGKLNLGNDGIGVRVDDSSNNTIGGIAATPSNVISCNGTQGVVLIDGASNNLVEGDFIGTDVSGNHALGNGWSGLDINGSNNNTIGGTTAAACNVISANGTSSTGGDGIHILNSSSGNLVVGNDIGIDFAGTKGMGNSIDGVGIDTGSNHNTVGGTTAGARNVISSNVDNGVDLEGPSTYNLVEGNYIGTNAAGTAALANTNDGVLVWNGGSDNTIGGTTAAAANLISYNKVNGVELKGAGDGNVVEDDTIYGNGTGQQWNAGVNISNSPDSTVSGCKITENPGWGIILSGTSTGSSIISKTNPNTVLNNELGDIAY